MKIFKHEGKGHYIGSVVIVAAKDIEEASSLISAELNECGLCGEALEIEEVKVSRKTPTVIHLDSGDY